MERSQDAPIIPPTPSVQQSYIPPTPTVQQSYTPPFTGEASFSSVPPVITTESEKDTSMLRAGLEEKPRVILMTTIGSLWGFGIGAFLGGRQSGLQYLAENAHRLPTTVQGWYFYHKTKNYKMMLGGMKKGMRYAGKTGGLCLLYGSLEAALDDVRQEPDVLNSVAAGVMTGTIFSTLSKFLFRFSQECTKPKRKMYSKTFKRII
ncbi:hypothetical protein RO3G_04873 [Rhizopus delemar RA 99-880]|uniref:Mitochondrial import inner membrane translocase subunit TIM22 n=1 Tax=Rhizopus delemar (strain RA 99-880 / ATCC MYA-4621 / FGSC 9543 / NRRL 43880) TaxID=246409 RepID=I1BVD8_RHIO9|nr:hypothetical protein RO3G_04873 [Rhizopus delemar RA 99-880]|eukprot:EIE80168.1 hypothetical protein RO3G_04873 [Rhizopus delemar RA 99-880]